MTLTGTVTGPNQATLFEKAIEEARTYYNQDCVSVELSNETTRELYRLNNGETGIEYEADYEAKPGHFPNWPHGHKCTQCGQEAK